METNIRILASSTSVCLTSKKNLLSLTYFFFHRRATVGYQNDAILDVNCNILNQIAPGRDSKKPAEEELTKFNISSSRLDVTR